MLRFLLIVGVHPRGCGGARSARADRSWSAGPSPRVRGSLQEVELRRVSIGSIPAGAGEPPPMSSTARRARVHPRGCGGATSALRWTMADPGPSPRVRGSQCEDITQSLQHGSIPAGAGEPAIGQAGKPRDGVHPRGCGGAFRATSIAGPIQGPSPRVRGSHVSAFVRRSCLGPSPRVRGSPPDERPDHEIGGSIPAGAGEPAGSLTATSCRGVHPRGCGGARTGPER